MSLTITIPGAVEATTGATAPATLTIGVGTPGAPGPQGPAGPGVPAGGTSGQFLQKIDGVSYNTDWVTVNLSQYAVKANNLSDLTSASTARSNLGLGTMATATASDYSTTTVANGLYYPLSSNPSGYLTSSALTGYATQSYVSANFAPIAAGVPTGGTVGQVLTKNSGTAYDASWATIIPGDRYVTTSSTSNSVSNGTKTFTVGTGLSYSSQQDVVISYDAANHMHALVTSYDSGTGVLVVDVQNHTGAGTYSSWTVNVGGTTPLQTVEWGEILGTLGDQGDLSSALNSKLESTTAASTYAALAGATFTGEVILPASTTSNAGLTITPGVAPSAPVNGELWATTSDLQVRLNGVTETLAEQSWVTSQGYLTSSALTPYAPLAGATFTGLVTTAVPTTTTAGFNLPHGTGPTTPVNGDLWTTTGGLFLRQNGTTKQFVDFDSTQTINGSKTFSNANVSLGTSTAAGTINVGTGATISASTKTVNVGTAGVSGSTTNINIGSAVSGATSTTTVNGTLTATGTTLNLGNSTAASTINVGTGATLTATTKAVNIGTSGVAGSTTNIAIGSTTGTSTTTLQGTTNGVTVAADTNSTALATTAFVVGQAGSATPLVDGTAAVGTSLRYARQDHVHPTDTTRAALASPTFTGVPAAPTAAQNTNTTQLATTAFVLGQASSTTPLVDGTAAVGTATTFARADHVHPTDTTRAPLASPALTGTPTAPTATAGTNTTQIATTAFVTAAVPAVATLTESRQFTNATKITPALNDLWALMSQDYIDIDRLNFTYTTTGTPQWNQVGSITTSTRLNATGASSVIGRPFGTSQIDQVSPFLFRENWASNINFNKKTYLSGRAGSFLLLTDATFNQAFYFGKVEGDAIGDLTRRGFGWRWTGGAGSRFVNLVVHNGTTQTTVQSSFAVTQEVAFDWDLYSDGAGNVTLYINGTAVATSNAGPTSYQSAGAYAWWREETWTTAAPSYANCTSYFRGGRAAILNY